MKATNRQRILDFLRSNGSITALDAVYEVHPPITALSQEISRLEQDGHEFEHIAEKNEHTHWTRYKWVKAPVLELEVIGL